MLLTPHVMVGMVVARAVPNPVLAPVISVIMHFLGDLFPHWDFYSNTTKEQKLKGWRPVAVMADFGLGIAVGLTFTLHALWVQQNTRLAVMFFVCGIASVLPDALEAPHIFSNKNYKFVEKLTSVQRRLQTQLAFPWGLFSQLLVIGLCLLLLA